MAPLFSIIIPVYDVAPYLRECLDSVLAQTFADWEAVCVDDGSRDGSAAILDEYAARDERFRVTHLPNVGVSVARNIGMDIAVGEYVTFLDGDDVYEPFWLRSFSDVIESTGADLVRLRQVVWDGRSHKAAHGAGEGLVVYSGADEIARWGFSEYTARGWSWLNAIRRSCLEGESRASRTRFPVAMELMEDNIFMLNVLPRVRKACQGEVAGYLYRQRANSACAGKRRVDTLSRLFYEAAPLFAAAGAESARHLSWMLGGAVLEWRKFRDRSEDGADEAVIARLLDARKSSMFRLSSVPARWWLGFAALVFMRTFDVIDCLLFLQRLCFNVRH